MNKTAIKNFAIWARRKLISDITYKAGLLGINDKGISEPLPISTDNIQFFDIGTGKPTEIANDEIKQRKALVTRIKEKESTSDYKTAYQYVVEEVAYTWFNRLIAIRFMEVNDYLPSRVRVLSSHIQGKSEPDIVTAPNDTDMEFSAYEQDRIMQLKDENKLDELFRMLFIKQCNMLNEVLPGLFEKTSDYTELLLNISFTDQEGIVDHLINDIAEDDFTEAVEIIGWLYQYYNTEPKDEVFAQLKNNIKISKEKIPAATQLFTPDWIVRYMVDNTVGKLWLEKEPNSRLEQELDYYIVSDSNFSNEMDKMNIEEVTIIDPCMGSGHILVYAFEVLMRIYESQGYIAREAASKIVENNLYGLDIDDRAYQLAYFAIMMKARKYDRRFLERGIQPNVYAIKESNGINKQIISNLGKALSEIERNYATNKIEQLIDIMKDAKEYGSILNIDEYEWQLLRKYVDSLNIDGQMTFDDIDLFKNVEEINGLIRICEVMSLKYDVVVTNPPYMGAGGMSPNMSEYVSKEYPTGKADLYSVFMLKAFNMSKDNGLVGMMTSYTWMFLSGYQDIREESIYSHSLLSLIQPEYHSFFEEAYVPICTFVLRNLKTEESSVFIRLEEFTGAKIQATKALEGIKDANSSFRYSFDTNLLKQVPGSPLIYWATPSVFDQYRECAQVKDICPPKPGLSTGKNDRFLRYWYEVTFNKISYTGLSEKKWYPINKGGEFRRWYGNHQYIVNWENDGNEIRNFRTPKGKLKSRPQNLQYNFKETISWSMISTGKISLRYYPRYFMQNAAAICCYPEDEMFHFMLGFLNSKPAQLYADMLSPTMNTNAGDIAKIPVVIDEGIKGSVKEKVENCIQVVKEEWDSNETSWDFTKHPLIRPKGIKSEKISEAYEKLVKVNQDRRKNIKFNEEMINKIFIKLYNLEGEIQYISEDKYNSIKEIDRMATVKSFISYAVGCMFGRYSLDADGIVFAGGSLDKGKYNSYLPVIDNCIPITDEEYFEDDIVGRFVEFVKVVYGKETLEENLDFIAKVLGGKGDTSREVIRNYFIKDFFKDHVKTYQKRPIYWLYESGKQNGFKALIYMHRYTADTTGIVRVDYLHKMQKIYVGEIDRMQDMIENSTHARDVAQAEKRKEKLIKQLKETKEYDEKIAHIALSRIDIDLDDGVKVNYDKSQTAHDGKRLDILAKI